MSGPVHTSPSGSAPVQALPQDRNMEKLQKQARDFEAVFAGKLINTMLSTVEKGEFSGGSAEETFQGLLGERMGDAMAAQGGLGIAPSVLAQLIRLQGDSHE
jgi:Rod binding domain-containing protein